MIRPGKIVLLAGLLSACGRADGPEGFYAGPLTPVGQGTTCPASRATLQIRRDVAIFVPAEGTWVLQGVVAPDGSVTADRSQVGVNKQVYDTTFEGRQTGDAVTGSYTTPTCRFRVALNRR